MNAPEAQLVGRILSRPGCRLFYRCRQSTSGKWVVFLHGAGMDGHMFDPQLSAVPDDVGIICWDARAHGQSQLQGRFRYADMCADLEAVVASLAAEELSLVGQSMGGNLAQTFTDRNPGAVNRLVLIDCTTNHGPLTRVDQLALKSTGPILSLYPWNVAVRQSARACGTVPATVAYAEQCLRHIGKQRFVQVMDFWSEALRPDPSYRLPVPTLALVGAHDRSGNIAKAMDRLQEVDPHVRVVTIPDAAHNSNMDQPAVTNEELRTFLGW